MLQKQALPTSTFNVLKKISPLDFLKDFNLVGGTALALYWGHRISDDIDLFTDKKNELLYLEGELNKIEGAEFISRTPIGLFYSIDSVKTDFLIYPYPFALKSYTEDSIQLAHLDDTVTMKLGAITNRGAKKDFVDLYYILQHYSFEKLCSLYTEKYKTKNLLALFRSLTYFDDAETKDMPELLIDKKLTWQTIKKEIEKKVKEYIG
jgi:Nucleotidyl transferase AbiEii toxin, Type IV TA system